MCDARELEETGVSDKDLINAFWGAGGLWVPQPAGTQGGTVVRHLAGSEHRPFSAGKKDFLSFLSLPR